MSKKVQIREGVCRDCRYFIQHYIRWHKFDKFMPYDGGHCIRSDRPKNKIPGNVACESFERRFQREEENILCTVSCYGKGHKRKEARS